MDLWLSFAVAGILSLLIGTAAALLVTALILLLVPMVRA